MMCIAGTALACVITYGFYETKKPTSVFIFWNSIEVLIILVDLLMSKWEGVSHRNTRYCVIEFTLSTTSCQNFFENCSPIVFRDRFLPFIDVISTICHSPNLHITTRKLTEKNPLASIHKGYLTMWCVSVHLIFSIRGTNITFLRQQNMRLRWRLWSLVMIE